MTSILETIEKSLEALAKLLKTLLKKGKDLGTGKKAEALKKLLEAGEKLLDKIEEGLTTLAKFFTTLNQKSWWDIFSNALETFEELLKLLAKFGGEGLGFFLKLIAKFMTGLSDLSEGYKPEQGKE